jgi:pyridoxal phosphate enzyme (YggS family)
MSVADNLRLVRNQIVEAARRAGRDPGRVRLMAVTKTVDDDRICEAIRAGVEIIGENYVQEARRKIGQMGENIRWHLIGRLQTNKAKYAVRLFEMIHSVDRLELAREIDRRAREAGRVMKILIEINVAGEATKSGVPLADAAELVRQVALFPNLSIQGLMTMPPWCDDPAETRPYFRTMRELADRIAAEATAGVAMHELSMGTTDDYTMAVEEGATIVRIGRGIFGERPTRNTVAEE